MYNVYLITNKTNSKQYVGITKYNIQLRFTQHKRKGFLVTKAIKKYGVDSFAIELIASANTLDAAHKLEVLYIEQYSCKCPNGYNLTDGGLGIPGVKRTKEGNERISTAMRKMHSEKRGGMHGKIHSEETKSKMSLTGKGKPRPWLIGRKLSEEAIAKMKAGKLWPVSEETKKRISLNHADVSGKNNPMYGRKHSIETIRKIKAKRMERYLNTSSYITEIHALEIYNLAWNSTLTQERIGEMFGITRSRVSNIKRGRAWNEITGHNHPGY